jgi:hypothetical protein
VKAAIVDLGLKLCLSPEHNTGAFISKMFPLIWYWTLLGPEIFSTSQRSDVAQENHGVVNSDHGTRPCTQLQAQADRVSRTNTGIVENFCRGSTQVYCLRHGDIPF